MRTTRYPPDPPLSVTFNVLEPWAVMVRLRSVFEASMSSTPKYSTPAYATRADVRGLELLGRRTSSRNRRPGTAATVQVSTKITGEEPVLVYVFAARTSTVSEQAALAVPTPGW